MNGGSFQSDTPGVTLPEPQPALFDAARAETLSGYVFEGLQIRVEQENVGGIHSQLCDGLGDDCVEDQAQIEGG